MLGTVLLASASVSQAALFDCASEPGFCIGEGDTVIFKYLGTSSTMGLFGTLQVVGDSILASATDFRAESNNTTGLTDIQTADANGSMQVTAKPGYQIQAVDIVEFGDYLMTSGDTAVSVSGIAAIWEWGKFGSTYTASALNVTGYGADDVGGLLQTRDTVDPNLWDAKWNSGVLADGILDIGLELQNNLSATTMNAGEIAWVEKKISAVEVGVTTAVIPLPAAMWLFGSGLLGLAGIARRKSRA